MNMPTGNLEVKQVPLWSVAVFALSMAFSIGGLYITVQTHTDAINGLKDDFDDSKELERQSMSQAKVTSYQVNRIEKTLDKVTASLDKIEKSVK